MEDPLSSIFGVSARELFAKRELFATHGALERLPAFMRTGPMENVDSLCGNYSGALEIAQGNAESGVQVPVQGVHASVLLRLGLTVYFTELRRALPFAHGWLKGLENVLGVPECTSLAAFANARGSGLSLHHDRFDQLFFQLRGRKRFRHAPNRLVEQPDVQFSPAAAAPPEFGRAYRHGFPPNGTSGLLERLETLVLEPGSAFFMPAGTWHTTAGQDEESLSMVVVVRAPSRLDVLLTYLDQYAGQSPDWRARPYGAWAGDATAEAEHATFARLLSDLTRRMPGLLTAQAFAAWSAHGYATGSLPEYPRTLPCERFIRLPNATARIEPSDLPGKLRCVVLSGPTSRLPVKELAFDAEARPLLAWVLELDRAFTVDEAAEKFAPIAREPVAELLVSLAQAGIIRPLPGPEWDEASPARAAGNGAD